MPRSAKIPMNEEKTFSKTAIFVGLTAGITDAHVVKLVDMPS